MDPIKVYTFSLSIGLGQNVGNDTSTFEGGFLNSLFLDVYSMIVDTTFDTRSKSFRVDMFSFSNASICSISFKCFINYPGGLL